MKIRRTREKYDDAKRSSIILDLGLAQCNEAVKGKKEDKLIKKIIITHIYSRF
jgi:hypothetical protein